DSVSLELNRHEILGLIGPNGAGKTTFINLVTGVLSPDSGRVWFKGHDVTSLPAFKRARLGMVRTFQILRPFISLSVRDNILVGLSYRYCDHLFAMLTRRDSRTIKQQIEEILAITSLERWADYPAGALPVGILRRVEIARALALKPELVLLDEPAAGLNDQELQEIRHFIANLRETLGLSILLVEHRMRFVMQACDRIVVMHRGRIIAAGKPEEIANDPLVIEVYLGQPKGT
ncbi:MAG: ABC transporter ATP-binding protein, partial [Anaerolineae bacterium]